MKILITNLILIFTLCSIAFGELIEKEVNYEANDLIMSGLMVYDDSFDGQRPGVLVVHEWWGQNDYAKKRARMLAKLGYTAFAVDMYGEGKTAENPKDAGKLAGEVYSNLENAKLRFQAAIEVLKKERTANPDKIGAVGYCFGGGILINMARLGVEIDGVVSFHGNLATENPVQEGVVKTKILVCHGSADPLVPEAQVEAFKDEMVSAKVDYEFIAYEGATHAFTNPKADETAKEFQLPVGYNEKADIESWEAMQKFFQKVFE